MEKIKIVIEKDRLIRINNPFGDIYSDYISRNSFEFFKGKSYGIVCEYGSGGEALSLLLSGEISMQLEKSFIDEKEVQKIDSGWYVGKKIMSKGVIKREISKEKAFKIAIDEYNKFHDINEIVSMFNLLPNKLEYGFSNNCEWERWRASLALGYACNKKIFCFPWMNTMIFYDCMYNSQVFKYFDDIKRDGGIIILPTSRKENIEGLVDDIIEIHCSRFEHTISESY
ncbi:MAG: hypothetical protein K6G64_08675 [Eubacterium sp.]|nr:hypothetical protein [Eubacterium sp.]